MRLARLAALGLAIGVIAGFAIALLRPRPQVRTGASSTGFGELDRADPRLAGSSRSLRAGDAGLWTNFQQAERLGTQSSSPQRPSTQSSSTQSSSTQRPSTQRPSTQRASADRAATAERAGRRVTG